MNELREQVQGLIDKHDVDSYRASVGAEHSSYPSPAVTTDRILALIAEAMLSTPAIDTHIEVSGDFRQDEFAGEYDAVEAGTKAQLAAAGITPGDAREGGEGE